MTQQVNRWTFEKFGTLWSVETPRVLSGPIRQRITDRLEVYDRVYSRFRSDSIVASMRHAAGAYVFPDDFAPLFAFYKKLYQLTEGKVTPLIGGQLEQAGYGPDYSLRPGVVGKLPDLDKVVDWDGGQTITTTIPITFDVGAAGKGYAVDLISALVDDEVDEYVIDASGDIRHRGASPDTIGLEHPLDPTKVIGVINVQNESLCASASNRRVWGDMHHIFDPTTGKPTQNVRATWVTAADTMTADGLATALFFVESPNNLAQHFEFSFVRMFVDGTVDYSPGFDGELYI